MVVPKYYKAIISDTESYFDMAQEDHANKDIMLMRKYGHIIDKGLHRRDIAPGHSHSYYVLLKKLVNKLSSSEYASDSILAQKNAGEEVKLRKLLNIPNDFFDYILCRDGLSRVYILLLVE